MNRWVKVLLVTGISFLLCLIFFSLLSNFNIDNKKLKDKVYIKNSFTYPLTNEEKEHIMIDTKVDTSIKKGKVGYISIKLYNKEIGNIKIYLKEKKSQKKKLFGFLNR